MEIAFTKMHGAGNDFVMIENLDGKIELSKEQVARLCNRRFGIGADGLILLNPPADEFAQATMVYYNADGGRVDMCGNGARCFTSFALQNGVGDGTQLTFKTDAGPMKADAQDGEFTIRMTPMHDLRLDQTLSTPHGSFEYHFMNTGVEHVIVFRDDVDQVDIKSEGSSIRYHTEFEPKGTNANFAEIQKDGVIKVRTYERGVEDETLACGTGVTAVAIAAALKGMAKAPVSLLVAGGDTLKIGFDLDGENVSNITLTGPAKNVFTGSAEV
ncbi:diaminopimelate epimerase [Verrucomicrobiia bacterium DG1235]|nr:diaminopimelate epimerase [Verrucomicrobiae bacterium DG1235]